jgi:hypothetical protein
MIEGNLQPRHLQSRRGEARLADRRRGEPSAWAKAKLRLLEYWDYPPASLFWLVLTAGTITVLKAAGL